VHGAKGLEASVVFLADTNDVTAGHAAPELIHLPASNVAKVSVAAGRR